MNLNFIFDLDGTLIDTRNLVLKSINGVLFFFNIIDTNLNALTLNTMNLPSSTQGIAVTC